MQSLWMLFAAFMFSIMGVCVKLGSSLYSTSEMVMYRGLIGVVALFVLIRLQGGTLKTAYPRQHAWRGFIGVVSLWLWFYAIGKLPLATAITLNYTAPIWIAAILFVAGWWHGTKRFELGLTLAILMSFAGVTLLLQPAFHADQWLGGLLGLCSGLLSSMAYLQVRKLGLMGEPEYRVVFFFSATGIAAGIVGALAGQALGNPAEAWHAHTGRGILLLLGMGLSAVIAQMAMTRAYRLGKTLLTANLQYSGILFSSLWSVLLWNDRISWMGWAGIGIIFVSGLAATYYNARSAGAQVAKPDVTTANDPIATEA
ncbi:S-adenosylmethionine uptake transporter [Noviherbaspirillum humi]|uniref:S-adenosylmethionine uptake transporter n=1 Tax=Noviherbaspirillum humi TaxID=1688639 RepID=A0A239EFT2_9BURK|nr:DMT family transporter [Noviherbaspirillum humi]SNS42764.1 S-adenosylmethionine uptake transporter [Noviherbaspirillum humi]